MTHLPPPRADTVEEVLEAANAGERGDWEFNTPSDDGKLIAMLTRYQWGEVQKLCDAATPGPWRVADTEEETNSWWSGGAVTGCVVVPDKMDDQTFAICATNDDGLPAEQNITDAAFIAAARTALPAALAQLATLTAEAERLKWENQSIRELMNVYNLGGWTDAIAPMQRALKAEAEVDRLRQKPAIQELLKRDDAITALTAEVAGWEERWKQMEALLTTRQKERLRDRLNEAGR